MRIENLACLSYVFCTIKVNDVVFFTLLSDFRILRLYIANSKNIENCPSRVKNVQYVHGRIIELQENELSSNQYRGVLRTPSMIYDATFCKMSELNSSIFANASS